VIASLALLILFLLGAFFVSFALTESKIAQSHEVAAKAYYLSEAGINEAIWRLKNDSDWQNNFEDKPACETWQDEFSRSYVEGSLTSVSIENMRCAEGELVATTTIFFAEGKSAQRVIKVKVIKALGSLTEDSSVFAGSPSGESSIRASYLNLYRGNMFINNNLNIKFWSTVNVNDNPSTPEIEGKTLVAGNLIVSDSSNLFSEAQCAKNVCNSTSTCECGAYPEKFGECKVDGCPPNSIEIPAIDFSSDEPTSYKSRAQAAQDQGQCSIVGEDGDGNPLFTNTNCVFSESEFEDLLWQVGEGGKLVLEYMTNGSAVSTYYVQGGIDLKGGRELEINGILVAEKTINIGEKGKWGGYYGFNQVTVNDPGDGIPSGLLSQSKINFGPFSSFQETNITGLIYAEDEMTIISLPTAFEVVGGIIARKFSLISAWNPLNIYLDNDIIREGMWGGDDPPEGEAPPYSPIVTIEHWEESY